MTTLVLSGWSQPADALRDVVPNDSHFLDYADFPSEAALFAALEKVGEVGSLIGWSLGGLLAIRAVLAGSIAPQCMVLLAPPVQFVASAAFPHGMGVQTFTQFHANFYDNTPRTISRFRQLLVKGDSKAAGMMSHIQYHPRILETHLWLKWLDYLHDTSLIGADLSALPPTLIIHGEADAIAHPMNARYLADHAPTVLLHLLPETGHAPHLHAPTFLRKTILEFIRKAE